MEFIDSHCHPQLPQYKSDGDEVIKRAIEAGVGMICVGTDLETSKQGIKLAEKYPNVWASVGLHPNDNLDEEFKPEIYEELSKNPKVVAVGEIGLDYYRTTGIESQKIQKDRFIKQMELVRKLNKPVIVHSRQAFQDTYEILSDFKRITGVIHSFTYSLKEAQKFIDLGYYIGLNGIITFTEQYNDTVLNIPLEKILLETDAPFLSPVPNRGKRNEPAYVKFIAQKISELRKVSIEEIAQKTTENTKRLFCLTF